MNLKINNMGNLSFQRDQFIKVIYQAAKKNKSIYFISIDFGAPALDAFRFKLKKQFIHLGICEQNAIDFASAYVFVPKTSAQVRAQSSDKTLDLVATFPGTVQSSLFDTQPAL